MASGGGGGGHGGGGHGGGHKKHEEHEEHEEHVNHEAWVIPYADMLTLLMVMFLALFATGRVDMEKLKKLAESMRHEFGGGSSAQVVSINQGSSGSTPMQGGDGIFNAEKPPAPTKPTDMQIEQARQQHDLKAAQDEIKKLQEFEETLKTNSNIAGLGQGLDFKIEGRGLVVTVLSDAVLFAPGSATLETNSWMVLQPIGDALKNIPNNISVEGYTDSQPILTSRYSSNWSLSSERANSVRKFFQDGGIEPTRLAVAGYGENRPVGDNNTPEGRAKNRRVEIVVLTDISLQPVINAAANVGSGA